MEIAYTFAGHDNPGMLFTRLSKCRDSKFKRINPESFPGNYICIVPILDPWRLNRELCIKNGVEYFPEKITEHVKKDIKTGKCILVMDYSNEALDTSKHTTRLLRIIVEQLEPPDKGVILVQQNRKLPSKQQLTCDPATLNKFTFFYYDYYIKATLDKLAHLATENSSYSEDFLSFDSYAAYKCNTFLNLNGTPRPHRLALWLQLHERNLANNSLTSFLGFETAKGNNLKPVCIKALSDPIFRMMTNDCQTILDEKVIFELIEPTYLGDTLPKNINLLALDIPKDIYNKTCFSIVSESDFSDGSIARITEKTIKALAMGHPVIILGNPGSLALAEILGFRVFRSVISDLYDNITDPVARFHAVLLNIQGVLNSIKIDKTQFLRAIYQDSKYNHTHAYTTARDAYYQEYEAPLLKHLGKAINSCRSTRGIPA